MGISRIKPAPANVTGVEAEQSLTDGQLQIHHRIAGISWS